MFLSRSVSRGNNALPNQLSRLLGLKALSNLLSACVVTQQEGGVGRGRHVNERELGRRPTEPLKNGPWELEQSEKPRAQGRCKA